MVCEPFQRLIALGKLCAYRYDGFWGCMDTFKEKQRLDDMYAAGEAHWEVWQQRAARRPRAQPRGRPPLQARAAGVS